MDWKSLGQEVAKLGLPLLGAALPLPGGMAIGTALAAMVGSSSTKPEDILATLTSSADALQKAHQFEETHQEKMLEITTNAEIEARKADSADVASVNTTMTAEMNNSASEAWYQKAWRPANGFVVALGSLFAVIAVCTLHYIAMKANDITALNSIPSLAFNIAAILAVPGAAVGITAWHRGVGQVEQIKANAAR